MRFLTFFKIYFFFHLFIYFFTTLNMISHVKIGNYYFEEHILEYFIFMIEVNEKAFQKKKKKS